MVSCKKDKDNDKNTKCNEQNITRALDRYTQSATKYFEEGTVQSCEEFKSAAISFYNVAKNCSAKYGGVITEADLDEIKNLDCSE